jgi:hypothetical protein
MNDNLNLDSKTVGSVNVHSEERVEGVSRIRKSKKDRQYNGQIKKDKQKNNYLQNITQKTKDGARRTPLQIGGELRCSERISSSCSTCGTRCVVLTY